MEYIPETYIIDINKPLLSDEEKEFIEKDSKGFWISKPAAFNCARGIRLIKDIDHFKKEFKRIKSESFYISRTGIMSSPYFDSQNKVSVI
jgi:hypothetical protein